MGIFVTVQIGNETHKIELDENSAVASLQEILEKETGVIARKQKLIHKGKVLKSEQTLKEAKIKNGGKILMLSSVGVQTKGQTALAVTSQEKLKAAKAKCDQILKEKGLVEKGATSSVPTISLEDQAKTWAKIKLISLRERGLAIFPQQAISVGPNAESADISHNKFDALPDTISELVNLRTFQMSHNAFTERGLPTSLFHLQFLERLHLDHNQIETLPDEIGCLISLNRLTVQNNRLKKLPTSISKLTNLVELNLANNSLQEFTIELGSCVSLRQINAENNVISEIPVAFSTLTSLRVLNLNKNRIKSVPSEILKECKSMVMLALHENPITMEAFREIDGFDEYENRRQTKCDKQLDMDVTFEGFDEGADFTEWQRY